MPVGWAVAYSENRGSFSVPPVLSASYFFSAVGDCIEKAGRVIASGKCTNALLRLMVASVALVASQFLYRASPEVGPVLKPRISLP